MKKNLDIANRLCQSSGPSLNRASTVLTFELVKNKIYGVTVQMKVTQHFFLVEKFSSEAENTIISDHFDKN